MAALKAMLKKEYDRGVKDGIEKGRNMFNDWTYLRAKAEGLIDPNDV